MYPKIGIQKGFSFLFFCSFLFLQPQKGDEEEEEIFFEELSLSL